MSRGKRNNITRNFNINLLKPHIKWNKLYEHFNLHQLIDKPTRITTNSETLIDHIYATTKQNTAEVCSPVCGCSDHLPICITWFKKGVEIPKAAHKEIQHRCFTHFHKDAFLLDLVPSQLSEVNQYTDPDESLELWYITFSSVYNKHAPFMTKRVKYTRKPPWSMLIINRTKCFVPKLKSFIGVCILAVSYTHLRAHET